jgi:hypothetical protein
MALMETIGPCELWIANCSIEQQICHSIQRWLYKYERHSSMIQFQNCKDWQGMCKLTL